jgi:nucleoside recognition membrane protein YjiH
MRDYNDIGSDELSDAEFNQYVARDSEILDILNERVAAGDDLTKLLNSAFGKEIRKTLVAQKVIAMQSCANAIGKSEQAQYDAKVAYDVICRVESIFGHIIIGKNEALKELKNISKINGEY